MLRTLCWLSTTLPVAFVPRPLTWPWRSSQSSKHFLLAHVNAEGFINMMTQCVREFEVAHDTEAIESVVVNLNRMHKLLSLSCETLTSCFNLMAHQVREPKATICTNAAEQVPVRPANAEWIHSADGTRGGGGANVTGSHNMASLPAFSGIDLNVAATKEIVQHNTCAPRETEKNNMTVPEEAMAPSMAAPRTGSFYFFT